MRNLSTESAIYGVVLVAGLVMIVGESVETSWEVFAKVCATVVVFWAAHVYAGIVAHLGDELGSAVPLRQRIWSAARVAAAHSWGMLLAAVLPLFVLLLGHGTILDDESAVWGALWLCVMLLGVFGYAKVAAWTTNLWLRLASGGITAALGVVLVVLKASVH